MSARGVIRNKQLAQQINDFGGLCRHRNITPTDIDGLIDYNGVAYVLLEGKHINAGIPYGQLRAIENVATSLAKGGAMVTAIIYTHEVPFEQSIYVADCTVKQFFYQAKWYYPPEHMTVVQAIERFENKCRELGLAI